MDIPVDRIRELLDQRDALDEELTKLITGQKERKPQRCSVCLAEGHTARSCPQKKE